MPRLARRGKIGGLLSGPRAKDHTFDPECEEGPGEVTDSAPESSDDEPKQKERTPPPQASAAAPAQVPSSPGLLGERRGGQSKRPQFFVAEPTPLNASELRVDPALAPKSGPKGGRPRKSAAAQLQAQMSSANPTMMGAPAAAAAHEVHFEDEEEQAQYQPQPQAPPQRRPMPVASAPPAPQQHQPQMHQQPESLMDRKEEYSGRDLLIIWGAGLAFGAILWYTAGMIRDAMRGPPPA